MSRKQLYRRRTVLLAAFALILLFGSSLKDSLAYFTTYTTTRGSARLVLGSKTEIEEEIIKDIKGFIKEIQIRNTGDADCFVRARIYAGSLLQLTESEIVPEGGAAHWRKDADGWWYYESVLKPGEATNILSVKIGVSSELMDLDIDNFNVIVVQESTPALYQEDGTPYADWNLSIKSEESEVAGS